MSFHFSGKKVKKKNVFQSNLQNFQSYLKKYAKNPQQKTKKRIQRVAKTSAGSLSNDEQCVNDSS